MNPAGAPPEVAVASPPERATPAGTPPAGTPPADTPRTPPKRRSRLSTLLAVTVVVVIALASLATLPMVGTPDTIVDASTDALVFRPDRIVDLVALARPRFGVASGARVFDGLPLGRPVPAWLGTAPDDTLLVQRLQITPGCEVGLETMVDGLLRIDVRSAPAHVAPVECALSMEFLRGSPDAPERAVRQEVEQQVAVSTPVRFELRFDEPLRFRRFGVSAIGFITNESGTPESAIRGAAVRLPAHGIPGDTVYAGDWLTLGRAQGELTEMRVDDRIHALFKGTSSDPRIAGRRLLPSLLRQVVYWEWFTRTLAVLAVLLPLTLTLIDRGRRNDGDARRETM